MLSVVGMLNYMGAAEGPVCTSLAEIEQNNDIPEQYRDARVTQAKYELQPEMFGADLSLEDWTHGAGMDFEPVFPDEFAVNETYSSGFVPAKPEQV